MSDKDQDVEEFRQGRYEEIHAAEKSLGVDHPDVVEMRRVAEIAISLYEQTLLSFDEPRQSSEKSNCRVGNLCSWVSKLLGLSK